MPIDLAMHDAASDVILSDQGALVRRSVLPGGVRLLTETDRSVRSVSIGMWIPRGSRDETPQHAGSTHVLEHLLFKGTARRSALDIATAFDEVGGESNAVTAKEHTFYYGRVRSADLPLAVDVLADMITSARLDAADLDVEREVILEELAMAEDDPTDVGHETFMAEVLGADTPLGRPVGGTVETVTALDAADVRAHYAEHYRPENLVVTAVGDLDHEALAALLEQRLADGGWELDPAAVPRGRSGGDDAVAAPASGAPAPGTPAPGTPAPVMSPAGASTDGTPTDGTPTDRMPTDGLPAGGARAAGLSVGPTRRLERPTEQSHLYLGGPGITATDEDRHTMSVLMAILGGGMSSRLFQHIREERGLAYSVYSFSAGYREAGLFGLYAACRPSRAAEVVRLMVGELETMAEHGVVEDEMRRALGQITGSLALGLEDTSSRMGRLGIAELVHGRFSTVDETVAHIAAVVPQDVQALAARLSENLTTRIDVGPAA